MGVTDITSVKANVTSLSKVLYEIVRKSSYHYCRAWVESIKTATTSIEGVLEIATAAEANALSVTNKIITPGRIPKATTSQKGVSELATVAEGAALSDTTRTITPGTIPKASTTQRGVIEVATAAQNDAGTAGTLAVIASELKRKYDALVAMITTGTSVSFTGTPSSPYSITSIYGRKIGGIRIVSCQFSSTAVSGLVYLKTISGYSGPGFSVWFACNHDNEIINEGGWGYVTNSGAIYAAVGKNGIWRFTVPIVS